MGTRKYPGFEQKCHACFAALNCFAVVRTRELCWDWMSFSSRCSRQRLVLPSSALCLQLAFIAMKKSKEPGFRIEFSALLCWFCKAGLEYVGAGPSPLLTRRRVGVGWEQVRLVIPHIHSVIDRAVASASNAISQERSPVAAADLIALTEATAAGDLVVIQDCSLSV